MIDCDVAVVRADWPSELTALEQVMRLTIAAVRKPIRIWMFLTIVPHILRLSQSKRIFLGVWEFEGRSASAAIQLQRKSHIAVKSSVSSFAVSTVILRGVSGTAEDREEELIAWRDSSTKKVSLSGFVVRAYTTWH